MNRIGLTGGIGSGKSLVCKIFMHLGIPVFNADQQAKIIRQEDNTVQKQILSLFGTNDSTSLAALVFADRKKLDKLNNIIHPAVQKKYREWLSLQKSQLTIKEAAILFESGSYKDMDSIIVVTAPESLRIRRVMQRDNITKKEVLARMQNQWHQDQLTKQADYVICNDEKQMLLPQVVALWEKLKRAS